MEEPGQLALELQRITLGVPLALRVLVEMKGGGARFLREEIGTWNGRSEPTISRQDALYKLHAELADRFLLHVHDKDDRTAILALAITTAANKDLMIAYWGGRYSWSERMRELGRRYSLLSAGDLHPVVRGHLRRSLRTGKFREDTKAIAEALSDI